MEMTNRYNNINTLNQFLDELKYSLSQMKAKDLRKILLNLTLDSAKETYYNKKDILSGTAKSVNKKIRTYKTRGFKNALVDDFNRLKRFIHNFPEKYRHFINSINGLSKEQLVELIISMIFGIGIFFATSGGKDFEGGIPDLEIKVGGIGLHRSIWFHSIISGLTFEFVIRISFNMLNSVINHLPEDHHMIWDKIKDSIEKNKNLGIAALWLGIAVHLIKDTGLLVGNFQTYKDIPAGLKTEYHQAIMSANGLASTIFGTGNMKKYE